MDMGRIDDEKLEERSVYFGPSIKNKCFFQLKETNFHQQCLQSNSDTEDSTGLRIYSASHVAIRFLALYSDLLADKVVGEIGCGWVHVCIIALLLIVCNLELGQ
jgi:hypothetical protein